MSQALNDEKEPPWQQRVRQEKRRGTRQIPKSEKDYTCWKERRRLVWLICLRIRSDLPSKWHTILLWASFWGKYGQFSISSIIV